jgi:hypothetical protein
MAISIAVHLLILITMAFLYFSPPPADNKTFDTRLEAGSEFGAEDGLNELGGLDAGTVMPEPLAAPSEEAPSLTVLKSDAISVDPTAGFQGASGGNPGAGKGDGFGIAKFGPGGELVRGVEVKVGDPQFTLLWDSKADLDLHVVEPGGKEIYWLDQRGEKGGELDVDNREGFGPENIYWLKETKDGKRAMTLGPSGEYKWWVYYYRGFDGGVQPPTRWKVRVKANGEVKVYQGKLSGVDQQSKVYTLKLESSPGRPH